MKVTVVTTLTPTPENRRGISALIYALLKGRTNNVTAKVYTYNFNKIDEEEIAVISKQLNCGIEILPYRKSMFSRIIGEVWQARIDKFVRPSMLDGRLCTSQVQKLFLNDDADFFLLYPGGVSALTLREKNKKFVVLGPDCDILVRSRRLENPYRLSTRKMMVDDFMYLLKCIKKEKLWGDDNIKVAFVGMADYKMYTEVTGNENAHFFLHPFVKYLDKEIDFLQKKLKVIIPGNYDMYYNTDVDKMVKCFIQHKDVLQNNFEFTFLGKRWSPIDRQLKEAGFNAEFKTWVDDYPEELVQHDIQITPISFGTGTKGKVLDAMVNGLLVIGSDYALENICVRDMDSCVRYRDASHIASILISVANHRERYQAIAEKGRSQVLKFHDPTRISKRFFEIYGKEFGIR